MFFRRLIVIFAFGVNVNALLQVNKLVQLCGPYIQSLSIRSLIPSDIPVQRTTSPEMAELITSQRLDSNKIDHNNKRNGDVLPRGMLFISRVFLVVSFYLKLLIPTCFQITYH
jgi:hypothetical protein